MEERCCGRCRHGTSSAAQRLVRIVLPAALLEILTGCRTGLVLALITMITSEMIARQSGAGNILFNALDAGQYDTMFAMINHRPAQWASGSMPGSRYGRTWCDGRTAIRYPP